MGEWFGHGFQYADMGIGEREFRPGLDFMRGWDIVGGEVATCDSD